LWFNFRILNFDCPNGYFDSNSAWTARVSFHFTIRVPRNVFVELPDYSGTLAQLMCPGRWAAIEYQYYVRESVNLTTFWGKDKPGNAEPTCLVSDLTPDLAQQRYRCRMHIE
jgi:hypothetical protein